ncbi:MAG: hypothetical protein CL875_06305 [Dehalococcoidales bacterium]|nr:hypothetical protein [Dehalococcoidales bacterium]
MSQESLNATLEAVCHRKISMDTTAFVLGLLNGISFGMVLFLIAAGLSIIIGVMGILNLMHGALYMVGAYVGWR